MANTRYSHSVDLNNPTTSHSLAVLMVEPGSFVLDIGAADGSVARPLVARGCRVWAIEADPDAAAKAQSFCERVIVGDVEGLDLETAVESRRFDVVLLLDVLEHLRDPLGTLERARALLAPGGRIIVSIPNVTHGAVRVSLMSGNFNYTETGLLDKTHLRFFDRRSVETLFHNARLRIVERLRVVRALTETEISIDPSAIAPEILEALEADEDATTYQFVLAGVPDTGEYVPDSMSLAERLQRRAVELESQYLRLEAYVRSIESDYKARADTIEHLTTYTAKLESELERVRTELQADLTARSVVAEQEDEGAVLKAESELQRAALEAELERLRLELGSELQRRMQDLAQRDLELRHLQADLAVKESFITHLRQVTEDARTEHDRVKAAFEAERDQVRAELQSALGHRTQELAQKDTALRHLQADLAVKEAFITDLRQELLHLRGVANSAGLRIVNRVTDRLSHHPRTFKFLWRVAKRVAGPSKS